MLPFTGPGRPQLFRFGRVRDLVRRRLFHRVHRAQEGPAGLAAVLDLLGRQLRAADGARSGDGVVEGALFEVHAGTVARSASAITPAPAPVTAISVYANAKSGSTAIRTEIPRTAPSCRQQVEIAEPVANRDGGS